MKYRNIKTGVVIDVACKINSPNYEPIDAKKVEPKKPEKPVDVEDIKGDEVIPKKRKSRGKKK